MPLPFSTFEPYFYFKIKKIYKRKTEVTETVVIFIYCNRNFIDKARQSEICCLSQK